MTDEQMIASVDDPYRTADESGCPTDAGTVAWNWISELAQQQRAKGAALLVIEGTPVQGGGKVSRLYRGTTLLAVATTFRDDMNFTVLVRWVAPEIRYQQPCFEHEYLTPGCTNCAHPA